MLTLNPAETALVLIDLQEGILPFAGGPYDAQEVVTRAAALAERFRACGAPVVLVRVGWEPSFADALKQPVEQPAPARALPQNWWDYPAALAVQPQDIQVVKRQWGAFYGTDLDLQLRRRGIKNVVLGGISTNIGVESTARAAWEHGYALILAEDLCSAADAIQHDHSFRYIFPRIARIADSASVAGALRG